MTGPKISLDIPKTGNPFYAILERSASPHSPTSSESSAATDADRTVPTVANEYIWTPPAPDPKYWEHVAKAQKIRSGVTELKRSLGQRASGDEVQRLSKELRARERKLMRYIDHHVLDFDDVLQPSMIADNASDKRKPSGHIEQGIADNASDRRKPNGHIELGTVSPPISPDLGPNRPLPPLPTATQPQKPPVPQKHTQRTAALDSHGFITSYKKNAQLARTESQVAKPKSRLLWTGIFGAKNIKPVENRRRSGSAEEAQLIRGSRLTSMASVPTLAPVRGRSDTGQSVFVL
ncbi:hypothetical protein IW148_006221 [Coemansia sp. RSA 1199]|nr:hypothetical protein IW148_006221 [Coemansia sp. RSA 1199]